ncbi:hypothetical protein HYH02_009273 [Chlamydomonas schloesseri]|uniref:BTB domain-containing protein n=1 Tax=Chlamydomonas schloesseri TaxID=2026947 RepID=A0A835TPY3_9CHLO|nr:hypothetical protein HYH02_009273 [Chlamydomonas schloesseri]|eukprot:KAG2443196.1 hypothetical protein HYH02_009273 [Chlamydomonas schloesseri]
MVPSTDGATLRVSRLAGTVEQEEEAEAHDGPGTAARFTKKLVHVCSDHNGAIYVADDRSIRKVQLPEWMRAAPGGQHLQQQQQQQAGPSQPQPQTAPAVVSTLLHNRWGCKSHIRGLCHVAGGGAWGAEECLLFATRNALFRLPLGGAAAGGAAGETAAAEVDAGGNMPAGWLSLPAADAAGAAAGPGACSGGTAGADEPAAGGADEQVAAGGAWAPALVAGDLYEPKGEPMLDGVGAAVRFCRIGAGLALDWLGRAVVLDIVCDGKRGSPGAARLRFVSPDGSVTSGVSLPGQCFNPVVLPNGYLAVSQTLMANKVDVRSKGLLIADVGLMTPPPLAALPWAAGAGVGAAAVAAGAVEAQQPADVAAAMAAAMGTAEELGPEEAMWAEAALPAAMLLPAAQGPAGAGALVLAPPLAPAPAPAMTTAAAAATAAPALALPAAAHSGRDLLAADLGALLDAQPDGTADLVIVVGQHRFPAHRAVLAARSAHVKRLLLSQGAFSPTATSCSTGPGEARLELPGADPDAVPLVLQWVYTGSLARSSSSNSGNSSNSSSGGDFATVAQARAVAEVADRLQMLPLRDAAEAAVCAALSAANVVDCLLWAVRLCDEREASNSSAGGAGGSGDAGGGGSAAGSGGGVVGRDGGGGGDDGGNGGVGAQGGGGAFAARLLAQLREWYLQHYEAVWESAEDSVGRLMQERPQLAFELMRAQQKQSKRQRVH